MSKVIAIIDRPKNCQKCWFSMCYYSLPLSTHRKGYSCRLKEPCDREVEDFDYDEEVHLSNCPLREVPQKTTTWRGKSTNYQQGYRDGYNACIDEILRGSEENGQID